jgi:hypothetical protein
MHEFDLHQVRAAALRREAEQERLAREAVRRRRAARAEAVAQKAEDAAEDEEHSGRRRWFRVPRAA